MAAILTTTAVAVAGWLLFLALLVGRRTSHRPAAADAPPAWAATEPPAVVSLLAGRPTALGYPATLLDLAARGWFGLERRDGGPVMCVPGDNRSTGELTAYERQAYDHLVTRAGERRDVPAAALADGFAGPPAARYGDMKSRRDHFMEAFSRDVIEDSRRRGLSRPRMSEPAGCLLGLAALVPALASSLAVHAHRSHAYWIPVLAFVAMGFVTGVAHKGEKLTPAGRAVLRGWQARCAGPAAAIPAMPPAGGGAFGDLPPQWPTRQVAYAAALGRAPTAVQLFTGPSGQPRGKLIWSGYGGSWRQITIGDPGPRGWLGAGGTLLQILALILLSLLPPTVATAVLAHGELRAAAFGVLACDAVIVLYLLGKEASLPIHAEFDGQVIEAWLEDESGENSTSTDPCLAIDDGVSNRAWVFSVTREQYATFTPGTLVHARVNPRRNALLGIWALERDRPPRG
jgi:hypothetical protein